MKRFITILLALLIGAVAAPAQADVTVVVEIDKDKVIDIDENIFKTTSIDLDVSVDLDLTGAAKAQAIVNQRNENNISTQEFDEINFGDGVGVLGLKLSADTVNSILGNQGITAVNQDVGNNVNQAFDISGAMTDAGGVADAEAEVEQINRDNFATIVPDIEAETPGSLSVNLEGSIIGNSGIVSFNQNAGNHNNQANVVALAVGIGDHTVALSEAALGQLNTHGENAVVEEFVTKTSSISGSILNNTGVVGINQTSGNMANQANVVAVSASFAQLFTPLP